MSITGRLNPYSYVVQKFGVNYVAIATDVNFPVLSTESSATVMVQNAINAVDATGGGGSGGAGVVYVKQPVGTLGALTHKANVTVIQEVNGRIQVLNGVVDATFTSASPYPFTSQANSYLIYLDGSTYYARNGKTGVNDYSNANIATVINNALAALPSTGGTVLIKAGNHTITTPLLVYQNNTVLMGEGDAGALGLSTSTNQGTLLKLANSVNDDLIKVGNTNGPLNPNLLAIENVLIQNLALDGNRANNTSGHGIHGFSWSGGGIQKCTIHNMIGDGLFLDRAVAGGAGTGCCLDIHGNTIEFNTGNGINLQGSVYDFIHHNHIEINSGRGVFINTAKERIEDNNILQSGYNASQGNAYSAIEVGGNLNLVRGNYLEGNSFTGIKVVGSKNRIVHNQIEASGVQGAGYFYNSITITGTFNLVSNNTLTDGLAPQKTHLAIEEQGGAANNNICHNYTDVMHDGTYATVASPTSLWRDNYPKASIAAITVGASPYTYTNNDPYTEIVIITTVNTLTALTYRAQTGSIVVGIPYILNTGESMVFTYSGAAPLVQKIPQ